LFSSTVLIAIILPFTAGQFAEAEEVAEYKSETSDSAFDDRERRGRPFHFTILYIIVATYAFGNVWISNGDSSSISVTIILEFCF